MPSVRPPRTEPASPKPGSPQDGIGRDGALTGAAAQDRTGYQTALRALARLLARQAAAEYCARNAAATDITIDTIPDAPVRDAA